MLRELKCCVRPSSVLCTLLMLLIYMLFVVRACHVCWCTLSPAGLLRGCV